MNALPLLGAPPTTPTPRGGPLARKGFRPFFLLAAAFAAVVVPIWLLALAGLVRTDAYFDMVGWHGHEMVFGFTAAVIAGFLLTAAGNWTSRETLTGPALLGLSAVWVVARFALIVPSVPRLLVAIVDLAFLPAVALAIGRPIVRAKNYRNLVMVGVVLALWVANLAMHLDVLGVWPGVRRRAVLFGVNLAVLLVVVMAGRVFPMFTKNATKVTTIRSHPRVDALAIAAMVALTLLDALAPDGIAGTVVAGVAALVLVARAAHWGTRHVFREPLLWILHVTYAWIPAGLALRVAARLHPAIPLSLATHALTVGGIGGVTLGMMARVALGHTGRKLEVGKPITAAFALVTLSALVRVALPLLSPAHTTRAHQLSGVLFALAFGLFLAIYTPILTRPRIDNKPG